MHADPSSAARGPAAQRLINPMAPGMDPATGQPLPGPGAAQQQVTGHGQVSRQGVGAPAQPAHPGHPAHPQNPLHPAHGQAGHLQPQNRAHTAPVPGQYQAPVAPRRAAFLTTGAYQPSGDRGIDRMVALERALKQYGSPI